MNQFEDIFVRVKQKEKSKGCVGKMYYSLSIIIKGFDWHVYYLHFLK